MAETHRGSCFCGAVEVEAAGEPLDMGYCHCQDCRAYSGAPLVAFTLWNAGDVEVTKGADKLGRMQKSEMSVRRFCTDCGGHVMIDHPTLGLADVRAAILPSLAFRPSVHLNYASAVLPVRDGLPKLRDFPAEIGGSGAAMPE